MSAAEGVYEIALNCLSGLFGPSASGKPRLLQILGLALLAVAVVMVPAWLRRGGDPSLWVPIAAASFLLACVLGFAAHVASTAKRARRRY